MTNCAISSTPSPTGSGPIAAELMRPAARRLLTHPRDLERAVTDEISRGDANRVQLLARNARRKTTTAPALCPPER